jgi:hypothetical protein
MDLLESPIYERGWDAFELARDEDHRWMATRMLFNWRLIAAPLPDEDFGIAEHGWCYDNLPQIVVALAGFDPARQDEPAGWKKRAGMMRRAPASTRDAMDPLNAVRCQHGAVLAEGACQSVNCPDLAFYQGKARAAEGAR